MKLYNLTKNRIVIDRLRVAETYSERTRGLLGRKNIEKNEGLLIKNCRWIHMFFMKFPIDAVFLKRERGIPLSGTESRQGGTEQKRKENIYKVVKIFNNVKPWRLCAPVFDADSVLETKSSTAKDIISVDDELKLTEEL